MKGLEILGFRQTVGTPEQRVRGFCLASGRRQQFLVKQLFFLP